MSIPVTISVSLLQTCPYTWRKREARVVNRRMFNIPSLKHWPSTSVPSNRFDTAYSPANKGQMALVNDSVFILKDRILDGNLLTSRLEHFSPLSLFGVLNALQTLLRSPNALDASVFFSILFSTPSSFHVSRSLSPPLLPSVHLFVQFLCLSKLVFFFLLFFPLVNSW